MCDSNDATTQVLLDLIEGERATVRHLRSAAQGRDLHIDDLLGELKVLTREVDRLAAENSATREALRKYEGQPLPEAPAADHTNLLVQMILDVGTTYDERWDTILHDLTHGRKIPAVKAIRSVLGWMLKPALDLHDAIFETMVARTMTDLKADPDPESRLTEDGDRGLTAVEKTALSRLNEARATQTTSPDVPF